VRDAGVVYQQRIAGVSCAGVYVGNGQSASLLGISRQLVGEAWLGARNFRYAGSIGPYPVKEAVRATIRNIGNLLASRFTLLGLFGVDFVVNGEQVWPLEVNPRYTASVEVIERATGVSGISVHSDACRGSPLDPLSYVESAAVHGKAILFAHRPVRLSPAFVDWATKESQNEHWPKIADISPPNTPIRRGRPIVTVFANDANPDKAEEKLRAAAAEIERRVFS
jgi:predicted ATP-grasp superfamily ATP-dependent carboligase